jgi:hypothetical protein
MTKPEIIKGFLSCTRQISFIALVLFSCTISLFSQSPDEISVIAGKNRYSEELYVRTDRDIYIAGEEVFLKIFCFGRLTHNTSGISRVAYVSLIDNLSTPVLQVKIRITGLSGSGFFTLPDSLRSGNYYIASSTHWMQNFSPELYSYKAISIVNPFTGIDITKLPAPDPEVDTVIFYPESGKIVAGSETVIGFRCLGKSMNPVEIKGIITGPDNQIICHVQSDNNGFGLFRLNPPVKGALYFKAADGNPVTERFELPPADDSGVALSITEEREKDIFRVRVIMSPDFNVKERNYQLVYAPVSLTPFVLKEVSFTDGEIILNCNSLPDGLASIIITDETGHRYAERWIYNNHKQPLNLTVRSDKQVYSAREKVKINISIADHEGNPVEGDLLVSAVRSFIQHDTKNNPESDPEISGLPEVNDKSGVCDINDKLIFYKPEAELTVNSGLQKPEYLPEPDGHIIGGVIKNSVSGEPLKNEMIVLSFVGKIALCRFTKTDDNGRFTFVSLEVGTREIVIQPLSPEINQYFVELDNPFPGTFSRSFARGFNLDTGMLRMINSAIISMQVKRIYDPFMAGKLKAPEKSQINDFYGVPEFTTKMSGFIQLTSLREAIKEVVMGAVTTGRKGKTVINTIDKSNGHIVIRDPLVIVDGIPVFDHEKVLNIPGDQIEKIDVINSEYYILDIVLDGIINIITHKGNHSVIEYDKPVFRQEFEALQSGSDFSSPEYSDISQKGSRIPDFRNTLYWNPEVRTDATGKSVVEFYTSDEPGDFIILVEGYSSDGHKASTSIPLSVRGNKKADEE